jgi:alkaline phosphatase D
MLGARQESWLFAALANSRARWNLLGQGTVMSYLNEQAGKEPRYWTDAWNGYPAARARLMDALATKPIANPVVLSGDIHAFVVSGLHRQAANLDTPIIASELVATSITSQGINQKTFDEWRALNPNLLIATGQYRGYLRLDVSRERLQADLIAMDTVKKATAGARTLRSFVIEAGRPGPIAL